MTDITDQSIQTFLDTLASKSATPGGGSAAAIIGAQSAALTSMVCNLTIGKAKYAEVETEMRELLARSERLRTQLTEMIAADIAVFNEVMTAYGLPKDSDDEKNARSAAIQLALQAATDVPLACVKACAEAIELSRIAADKGNTAVISDAGVAVMAGYASLKSAALNVYVNANALKDRDFAETRLAELEALLKSASIDVEEIYQVVKAKL